MKNLQTILLLLFIISKVSAHEGEKPHGNDKIWNTGKTSEQGSFLMLKNGEVYIQKNNASISHFPLANLSTNEQKEIIERYKAIEKLNKEISVAPKTETKKGNINALLISFSLIVTPSGTITTNYNGFLQCNLALAINNLSLLDQSIIIYPNPSSDILNINLGTKLLEKDVKSISIYDLKGTEIFHSAVFKSSIDIKKFNRGTYIIKIQVSNSSITKRFFVN